MVLDGLGRFLTRENKVLTEVFQPEVRRHERPRHGDRPG